ncbi:MAG: NAD(P)/FAD-dependent oxidoreductase [Rhodospirillales bacterium]|nr:NAD(P)/FAD-dependent oxidoreductase [Rhodospirillales bacterium]
MSEIYKTDIAVIGAGPVGLFAVFECGMLGMRCHVIDSLPEIGGQCSALYPEKPIYDIPGYPRIDAGDLIARLEEQAQPFSPAYHLGQEVVSLRKSETKWLLETSAGQRIEAGGVIIAAGAGAFGPNRPPLDGIEAYEGISVFYMVRRKDDFVGKHVVIAGGGDSAVDWTLALADVAASVSLVHRRDKFRAAADSVEKIHRLAADKKIQLVVPYQLKGLEGQDGYLTGVRVESLDGDVHVLTADVLLPFYGLVPHLGPITEWGFDISGHHIPVDPGTCETNHPGIYAIGDIASYDNKLKLILTGFAEAAQAAHAAYHHLNPDRELHFEYSTTHGVPGIAKKA